MNIKMLLVNVRIRVLIRELNLSLLRQVSLLFLEEQGDNSLNRFEQGLSLPVE